MITNRMTPPVHLIRSRPLLSTLAPNPSSISDASPVETVGTSSGTPIAETCVDASARDLMGWHPSAIRESWAAEGTNLC